MSILVYTENIEGHFSKPAFEILTYGFDLAQKTGTDVAAITIGEVSDDELQKLSKYGAKQILHVKNDRLRSFDAGAYAKVLEGAANDVNAKVILFSTTFNSKALAPRLSARMKAGLVSNAVDMAEVSGNDLLVKKSVYSGKGFGVFRMNSDKKIISLSINAYKVQENAQSHNVRAFDVALESTDTRIRVTDQQRQRGKVSLTEAEVVISAGRGLKGPENWKMVEELAEVLGAATACSKPVSDMDWRPHSEHVGQTGLTISPNLYIAAGISGAIQHLAGVSSSKVICVINKDPEAPFFKAADYGIVGDVFEVLPKLINRAKEIKS